MSATYRATDVARAAGIAPRTARYVLRDEYGLAYEGSRASHVLGALARSDRTPTLDARVHEVAYSLAKAIDTARMRPVDALRISAYSPYRLCALVARIANECPGSTVHEVCDLWVCPNSADL